MTIGLMRLAGAITASVGAIGVGIALHEAGESKRTFLGTAAAVFVIGAAIPVIPILSVFKIVENESPLVEVAKLAMLALLPAAAAAIIAKKDKKVEAAFKAGIYSTSGHIGAHVGGLGGALALLARVDPPPGSSPAGMIPFAGGALLGAPTGTAAGLLLPRAISYLYDKCRSSTDTDADKMKISSSTEIDSQATANIKNK